MERAANKAERLLQLEQLLLAHPQGLHRAEIARRLGVHRSTVGRDIDTLSLRIPIWEDDKLLGIDRDQYLTHVRLTIHESMAVHLAARLMATRMDKHNPHAAAALRKLGDALKEFSPQVSRHLLASADVMDDAVQRHDPVYLDALEALTRAWSEGRMVRLWHQHGESGRVFEYEFAPYFIEPYAIGQTTHVIGWREPPGAVRTFKIERIRRIELTDRAYTIPKGFDPRGLLADAWGIWYTEGEPVEVALKFHPRLAGRVRETRWHRSEQVEEQPDGSLLWRARVAEPQEMLPWIRGWGADVEVLRPKELQEALIRESRRLAILYRVGEVARPPLYQRLWAKTDRRTGETHPLICHMIDVAQVALALWNEVLTKGIQAQFAETLDLEVGDAGRLIAFWAALHDLGKATPAFQRKWRPAQAELSQAGLVFPKVFANEPFSHGAASGQLLPSLLETETGLSPRLARGVARSVGGHHGAWPIPAHLQSMKTIQLGDENWDALRRDVVQAMEECLNPPAAEGVSPSYPEINALWTLLSGFVAVADWIGSAEKYFHYEEIPADLTQYVESSERKARQALNELNWVGWSPPDEPISFTRLFQVAAPRPMQAQAIELAERLNHPALVIIEAPTGVGKTEAALYLADQWARTLEQRGLYVAMPTMATSNQMFGRVQAMLRHRYQEGTVLPLLVHSQAKWSQDSTPPKVHIVDNQRNEMASSVEAMGWFLPRKRSLLAPFGVGTVDQALLSVLQTRHFFVRLFGLSHKTIVFDEVHAYDTYMSELFRRLLAWLRVVGTSVVILSATLPGKTRRDLLRAYAGTDAEVPPAPYPSITWAMNGQIGVIPVDAPQSRKLALEWTERAPEAIVARLESALQDGGCGAVICNTVKRAQAVYQALRKAKIVPKEDLILFHGRFPFGWRDRIERAVLKRFGKDGNRPQRAIVVATQVIEQSLDLDFDLMVSDLAPVDLLLQRAGRLHRHTRHTRPGLLRTPRLLIAAPDIENGTPKFERGDTYVYEAYVLLRTFRALQDRTHIRLPDDTSPLIESVYGEDTSLDGLLVQAKQKMEKRETEDVYKARLKLIPEPGAEDLLSKSNLGLAEDSPDIHTAFQALTRLGPPSISLVCLHRVDERLNTEPDGSGQEVDLNLKPDDTLTQALVYATVSVSHYPVLNYYREQQAPSGWREHPLLSRYYVAVFESGLCPLERTDYTLRLTSELGLEVLKM